MPGLELIWDDGESVSVHYRAFHFAVCPLTLHQTNPLFFYVG